MSEETSDAFVLFGATGDLAYKKIFPALHAAFKRKHPPFVVVGVSRGGSTCAGSGGDVAFWRAAARARPDAEWGVQPCQPCPLRRGVAPGPVELRGRGWCTRRAGRSAVAGGSHDIE